MQAMFFSVWWASYITPPFIRRAIEYLFVRPFLPVAVVLSCFTR
jgi:hypothetical protein